MFPVQIGSLKPIRWKWFLLDDFPIGHGFILDLGFIYHQLMKNMGNNGKTMENQVVDGLWVDIHFNQGYVVIWNWRFEWDTSWEIRPIDMGIPPLNGDRIICEIQWGCQHYGVRLKNVKDVGFVNHQTSAFCDVKAFWKRKSGELRPGFDRLASDAAAANVSTALALRGTQAMALVDPKGISTVPWGTGSTSNPWWEKRIKTACIFMVFYKLCQKCI